MIYYFFLLLIFLPPDTPSVRTIYEKTYFKPTEASYLKNNLSNPSSEYFFVYDKNGYKVEVGYYLKNEKSWVKTLYFRDEQGRVLNGRKLSSSGEIITQWFKTYEKKNLIRSEVFDKHCNLIQTQHYKYDESGRKTDLRIINADTNLGFKYSYHYDSQNNLIKEVAVDDKKRFGGVTIYKYDNSNNNIQKIAYTNDDKTYIFYNKFDANGNLIQEKKIQIGKNSPQITNYEYVYDNYSNWIVKIEKNNDFLIRITTRDIVYDK